MIKRFLILGAVILVVTAVALNQASAASPKTSQNFQVSLEHLEVHQEDVQAELCILMPSLEPWFPYATLTVDGEIVPNNEVALINAKDPAVMKSQTRCFLFTFPVSEADSVSPIGTLKLENLSLEVDGGLLTDAGADAARTRLHRDQPQLDFQVVVKSGKGGSGAYIQLLSKPEGMSDMQAIQMIQQASVDEIPGNWQIDVELK
jgi:hypothetical protein